MAKLKTVAATVKRILEVCPQARNSDSYLYLKVIECMDADNGTEVKWLSVHTFLMNINELGIPNFETVRRARQKIQAQYPELAACRKVDALRANNESAYRAFALSKVGVD